MKRYLLVLSAFLCCTSQLRAVDWSELSANPAEIEVANMVPVPLVVSSEKNGWSEVPPVFLDHKATIFQPKGDHQGFAYITVLRDGYLLLACNFSYQGNTSGDWQKDAWNEQEFRRHGWKAIKKKDLQGILINGHNREQVIFSKEVRAGQTMKLRCAKYDTPYPILLSR